MIISLKSNKTRKFISNHGTNKAIFDAIGLKPIKVQHMESSSTYMIVDHPSYRLTDEEVKQFFHVIEGHLTVEKPVKSDESMGETPEFPMSVLKQVTVKIHECTVASDNLESFISQLRSKFK